VMKEYNWPPLLVFMEQVLDLVQVLDVINVHARI
jgi:hypothetical protein